MIILIVYIKPFSNGKLEMPELPEVETIKRGLCPHLQDQSIQNVIIRNAALRWPISPNLEEVLQNQTVLGMQRRGKYLVFELSKGFLIIHLGMSGSLRLLKKTKAILPHDHVDFMLNSGQILRYNDPRRFGAILFTKEPYQDHPLLKHLGIEPLDPLFTGQYLKQRLIKHHAPIKSVLMNSKLITGIGNIYAAEALFLAFIHPQTPANQLTIQQCEQLVQAIKTTLQKAIEAGGTTLKDFVNSEGKPGYFSQQLYVYGRAGLSCLRCNSILESLQIGQRSTVFCSYCQKM